MIHKFNKQNNDFSILCFVFLYLCGATETAKNCTRDWLELNLWTCFLKNKLLTRRQGETQCSAKNFESFAELLNEAQLRLLVPTISVSFLHRTYNISNFISIAFTHRIYDILNFISVAFTHRIYDISNFMILINILFYNCAIFFLFRLKKFGTWWSDSPLRQRK